jgi:hypothetical protein
MGICKVFFEKENTIAWYGRERLGNVRVIECEIVTINLKYGTTFIVVEYVIYNLCRRITYFIIALEKLCNYDDRNLIIQPEGTTFRCSRDEVHTIIYSLPSLIHYLQLINTISN